MCPVKGALGGMVTVLVAGRTHQAVFALVDHIFAFCVSDVQITLRHDDQFKISQCPAEMRGTMLQ